jgi:tRNA (adenine22-N1)-methyltransferase
MTSIVKLGKRLQTIEKLVTTNYDHIWDCCCDHGLLGAALLNKQSSSVIHFVDIVPELMSELHLKLKQFYPQENLSSQQLTTSDNKTRWQTHCIDVNTLPLASYKKLGLEHNKESELQKDQSQQKANHKAKHLVIIAGVGGDLMCEFVNNIYKAHPNLDIDFLLCPVHHQYTLRQQLINLNLRLQQEVLVEENKRFYEVLLVKADAKADLKPITLTGKELWQTASEQEYRTAKRYLAKTLQHYQRMILGGSMDVASIIENYEAVEIKLCNI